MPTGNIGNLWPDTLDVQGHVYVLEISKGLAVDKSEGSVEGAVLTQRLPFAREVRQSHLPSTGTQLLPRLSIRGESHTSYIGIDPKRLRKAAQVSYERISVMGGLNSRAIKLALFPKGSKIWSG